MSPYFLKIFVSSFIHPFIYSLNRSCMTIQYLIIKDEPPGSKYWGYRDGEEDRHDPYSVNWEWAQNK